MPSIALFPYAASTTSRRFLLDTTLVPTTITRTSASVTIIIVVTGVKLEKSQTKTVLGNT